MGWLKAVGQGILWIAKNEAVRRVVLAFVKQKIAEKRADEKAVALATAQDEAKAANAELAAAPRVTVR